MGPMKSRQIIYIEYNTTEIVDFSIRRICEEYVST
jgi:hypothetical protein